MRRISYAACDCRSKAADVCNALLVAGARIISVCDGQHDYMVWFEHERAGDADFLVEVCQAAKDVKDFAEKKVYWDQQYRESHKALDALSTEIGNPCLEARADETMAGALVRYVIERYIRTDAAWREINGLPPLER